MDELNLVAPVLTDGEVIAKLKAIIAGKEEQVESLTKELQRSKRVCEKANAYNEDLRKQVEKLSAELVNKRGVGQNNQCIGIQVTSRDIDEALANKDWLLASEKANLSVADCVRAAAEEVTRQSGYVYDEASGYYYDSTSGYYYDAERSLYYDSNSGIYFFYNPETKTYDFHSQVDVSQFNHSHQSSDDLLKPSSGLAKRTKHTFDEAKEMVNSTNETKVERQSKKIKLQSVDVAETFSDSNGVNSGGDASPIMDESKLPSEPLSEQSSVEEGECSDSSNDEDEHKFFGDSCTEVSKEPLEESGTYWPPCVRCIVLETNICGLPIGSLFLVTCTGALVGRERNCDICLPDIEISKSHAQFTYSDSDNQYVVKDLGSQNGTFLNGERLSEAKTVSECRSIKHDDAIEFGTTKLLLHIHRGAETCDGCEPGQVQAALAATNPEKKEIKILSKVEKEQERKHALKQIKKKFGLEASAYEENVGLAANPAYVDRAKQRRHVKGSDNPYEKTEVASVDVAISSNNKGFKMMQKMGWASGETLGKSQLGLVEPIPMEGQVSKAGFGAAPLAVVHELRPPSEAKKRAKWKKARQRYQELQCPLATAAIEEVDDDFLQY